MRLATCRVFNSAITTFFGEKSTLFVCIPVPSDQVNLSQIKDKTIEYMYNYYI